MLLWKFGNKCILFNRMKEKKPNAFHTERFSFNRINGIWPHVLKAKSPIWTTMKAEAQVFSFLYQLMATPQTDNFSANITNLIKSTMQNWSLQLKSSEYTHLFWILSITQRKTSIQNTVWNTVQYKMTLRLLKELHNKENVDDPSVATAVSPWCASKNNLPQPF